MCFSPYLGVGGIPKGAWAQLVYAVFHTSSKMEIPETNLFGTLTIKKDTISYVKDVLAPLYVFFKPLVVNVHVVRLRSQATTFLFFTMTLLRLPFPSPQRLEHDG